MVRILTTVRDHYNIKLELPNYTLYELVSAFCTEIITEPPVYKYLWYKILYRNLLKAELEKKWSNDLIDLKLFFKNAEEKRAQFLFNPNSKNSKKLDFEKFLEKVVKIKKLLDKKDRFRHQRQIDSNFCRRKRLLRV